MIFQPVRSQTRSQNRFQLFLKDMEVNDDDVSRRCGEAVAKVQKIANYSIYTLLVESITEYFLVLHFLFTKSIFYPYYEKTFYRNCFTDTDLWL